MSNNQFDETLRRVISDEDIPYSEENWNALQQRLDKGKKNRVLLLLPFYYKTAAAACIAALGAIIWYNTADNSSVQPLAIQNNTSKPYIPAIVEKSVNPATPKANTSSVITTRHAIAVAKTSSYQNANIFEATQAASSKPILVTDTIEHKVVIAEASKTPAYENSKRSTTPIQIMDAPDIKTGSNINIAINGGYTIIQSGNGLSAGLAMKNKITNSVAIETAIGYVQGNQAIPQAAPSNGLGYSTTGSPSNGDQHGAMAAPTKRAYTWQQRNLPYIHLTPGLNIKMDKRLSGTLGVDVQKILLDKTTLTALNNDLAIESKKIPAVDPGIMLKCNYSFTKRIGCGIAYRKSVANAADPGNNYINRDYVLFQLQYTVIK